MAASGGFDIGGLLSSMQGIQDSWLDFSQDRLSRIASSPCELEAEIGSYWTGVLQPRIADITEGMGEVSAAVRASYARALQEWGGVPGIETSGYRGTDPFSDFLLNKIGYNAVVPFLVLLGPPGWIQAAGIRRWAYDRLPPPGAPSGTNSGVKIAPGVYLTGSSVPAALSSGTWQGSRVRRWYWEWRNTVRTGWYPTGIVGTATHPWPDAQWRRLLGELVGWTRPADHPAWWLVWQLGDPVTPESRVGQALALAEQLETARSQAEADCRALRQHQQDLETELVEQAGEAGAGARALGWGALVAAVVLGLAYAFRRK